MHQPTKVFQIQGAFTAEPLGLAEHTHPVTELQKRYRHLHNQPLQRVMSVQPALHSLRLPTPYHPNRACLDWPPGELCHGGPSHPISLQYRNAKLIKRPKQDQDQEAIRLVQSWTTRVEVDGVLRCATALLHVKNITSLYAPKEASLPLLRGIERHLAKSPEQAVTYQEEILKLEQAGYATKEAVSQTDDAFILHNMVQYNGKNRAIYNCSFQYKCDNLNDLFPGPTLDPSFLEEGAPQSSEDILARCHVSTVLDMPSDSSPHTLVCPEPPRSWRYVDSKSNPANNVTPWQVPTGGSWDRPSCSRLLTIGQRTPSSSPSMRKVN